MRKRRYAFTLTEVAVTIGVLAILSLGAMSYQYYAMEKVRNANTKMAAARLGLLILENWKIQGGSEQYDPTSLNLGVEQIPNSNLFLLEVDDIPFYLDLASEDIVNDDQTGTTLRSLSVCVQWRLDYQKKIPGSDDPSSLFRTYVRQDQSGG